MQSSAIASLQTLLLQRKTKEFISTIQKDAKSFAEIINKPTERGLSFLQLAAQEGLSDAVLVLCLHGASTDYQVNGKTALDTATQQQHDLIVKILKIFTPKTSGQDESILKAIYFYAVRQYNTPTGLNLPDASEPLCLGLMSLAAFLNKTDWIEYFLTRYTIYTYQNGTARTPAYWMASHIAALSKEVKKLIEDSKNNDPGKQSELKNAREKLAKIKELFDKLNINKDASMITAGQLQSDNRDDLVDTLYPSIHIPESFLEDKETLQPKYKNAYSEASRNKTKFVTQFSFDTRKALLEYAIKQNNFVAIAAMHSCFDMNHHYFISTTTSLPSIMEFELISQNLSFYSFISQLEPKMDFVKQLFQTNKKGILNLLLGSHLINKKLSEIELEIYNVLQKLDSEVFKLAKQRLSHHHADTESLSAQQAFSLLLEAFGLSYLARPKTSVATFAMLPDKPVQNILSFITGVEKKEELKDEKIKLKQLTQAEIKKKLEADKKAQEIKDNIILTSKRFYTIVSVQLANLDQALPKLELDYKDTQVIKSRLDNENKLLQEFVADIDSSANSKKKNWIRGIFFLTVMVPLSLLTSNGFCLYKLKAIQNSYIGDLTKILLNNGTTNCNAAFNLNTRFGCTNIIGWYRGGYYPITAPVPEVCAPVCDLLDTADKNFTGSCVTISFLIFLQIVLPFILNDFMRWNFKDFSINNLSNNLNKKLAAINSFLTNEIDAKNSGILVSRQINTILEKKQKEKAKIEANEKFLLNRKGIFTLFQTPEQKRPAHVIVNIPDYSEIKEEKEDFSEVVTVPNTGSLNDDASTSLLVKPAAAPRRSLCPSMCLVM